MVQLVELLDLQIVALFQVVALLQIVALLQLSSKLLLLVYFQESITGMANTCFEEMHEPFTDRCSYIVKP